LKWLAVGIGDITKKRVLPALGDEPRSEIVGLTHQSFGRQTRTQIVQIIQRAQEQSSSNQR
jgi:hypothetical protein